MEKLVYAVVLVHLICHHTSQHDSQQRLILAAQQIHVWMVEHAQQLVCLDTIVLVLQIQCHHDVRYAVAVVCRILVCMGVHVSTENILNIGFVYPFLIIKMYQVFKSLIYMLQALKTQVNDIDVFVLLEGLVLIVKQKVNISLSCSQAFSKTFSYSKWKNYLKNE